jgi:subtilisin family serine protease
VALFEADPRVEIVEPDYYRYLDAAGADPFFSELWGLENTGQNHFISGGGTAFEAQGTPDADVDLTAAWGMQSGQPTTIIAVVDSGVDVNHPDLVNSRWVNPADPADGLDNDGNGKTDDTYGWNFAGDGPGNNILVPPSSAFGFDHGTHVAGTIAAEANNTTGVAGVCPGCRVMALRIMGNGGVMRLSDEIQAIAYAKNHGARIMNASYGGPSWSLLERNALQTSGMLVVVAAGNDSLDNDMTIFIDLDGDGSPDAKSPSYPAAFDLPNILTVAASNHNDEYGYSTGCMVVGGLTRRQCSFTSWGRDSVDVAAPGVDVLSTVPVGSGDVGDDYAVFDGTSMATPHVAGVAGLVKSEHPGYSPVMLKNAVMRSVDHPAPLASMSTILFAGLKPGSFTRTNNGRVNAAAAVDASTAALPKTDGNVAGAVAMLGSKRGGVAWPGDVNDVYKRTLLKGKRYRVRIDGPAGSDFDLYVYRPGTKEIWQPGKTVARAFTFSADETATFRAPVRGTFYIQVTSWFSSGRYTLTVKRL